MEFGQFADQLQSLEKLHYAKLSVWAGASLIVGTGLLVLNVFLRVGSALLRQFAMQCAAWGTALLLLAFGFRRTIPLRDLAGAAQLDRFTWFHIGLDAGCVLLGATLAVIGWRLNRRLGLIGAGLGIIVQGLALGVFDLQLSAAILR